MIPFALTIAIAACAVHLIGWIAEQRRILGIRTKPLCCFYWVLVTAWVTTDYYQKLSHSFPWAAFLTVFVLMGIHAHLIGWQSRR